MIHFGNANHKTNSSNFVFHFITKVSYRPRDCVAIGKNVIPNECEESLRSLPLLGTRISRYTRNGYSTKTEPFHRGKKKGQPNRLTSFFLPLESYNKRHFSPRYFTGSGNSTMDLLCWWGLYSTSSSVPYLFLCLLDFKRFLYLCLLIFFFLFFTTLPINYLKYIW
jgi:hypothetical protein